MRARLEQEQAAARRRGRRGDARAPARLGARFRAPPSAARCPRQPQPPAAPPANQEQVQQRARRLPPFIAGGTSNSAAPLIACTLSITSKDALRFLTQFHPLSSLSASLSLACTLLLTSFFMSAIVSSRRARPSSSASRPGASAVADCRGSQCVKIRSKLQ